MATEDVLDKYTNAHRLGQLLRHYQREPERLYYALKFLSIPAKERRRQTLQVWYEIAKETISTEAVARRTKLAKFIIDNQRADLVFEIFAEDDFYLQPTLDLLKKHGLPVDCDVIEEIAA